MQAEDFCMQKLTSNNKPRKMLIFQPTEAGDDRKKLVMTRPAPNILLAKEIYQDPKCPYDEKEIMRALNQLLENKKVKEYNVQRDGEIIQVWELI